MHCHVCPTVVIDSLPRQVIGEMFGDVNSVIPVSLNFKNPHWEPDVLQRTEAILAELRKTHGREFSLSYARSRDTGFDTSSVENCELALRSPLNTIEEVPGSDGKALMKTRPCSYSYCSEANGWARNDAMKLIEDCVTKSSDATVREVSHSLLIATDA